MDKKYWDSYYQEHGKDKGISVSSSFAKFCMDKSFIKKGFQVVELGSGNGRDAVFFAHQSINIIAIDQSTNAIDIEKESLSNEVSQYLRQKTLDFIDEDYSKYEKIDAFYSRFTIHSVTKEDEKKLLPNIFNALKDGGLLCIEVRTTKDSLFGVGEYCGENTFMTDNHKRRFIDSQVFINKVLGLGFKLLYFTEEDNLSVYKNDNPILMRVVLQK